MNNIDTSGIVRQAREIAAVALRDETRYDGTPFISHADGVAFIVRDEIGLPPECAAAEYLHEATRAHRDIDISAFPQDVRAMVEGLNKISTIKPKDTRLEAENYKKLIVKYSTDPRVTVIKIADRLEVMRHLEMFPKSSRDQKLLETQMLYMPIAHQLGLYNINNELGNIYFRWMEPTQYRQIMAKLKATEKQREELMQEFIEPLKKKLSDEGIVYKLKVRTKTAYSIYRKMQVQKVPFEGVYDVFAIRFIIDCEPDPALEKDLCWKVYSFVTEEYEPDTHRLRDWLTTPRPNGYESLHITVKNKKGVYLEVQIRTRRMDDEAENGAAQPRAPGGGQPRGPAGSPYRRHFRIHSHRRAPHTRGRRIRAGLRLQHPQRHRQQVHRWQGQRQARPHSREAEDRRRGGDTHVQEPAPHPRLAELGRDLQGQGQDQAGTRRGGTQGRRRGPRDT